MAYTQLTSHQRCYISRHYRNLPLNQIAQNIGCHPATVSREIRRHSVNGTYCYRKAQQQSEVKKKNKKPTKLTTAVKQTVNKLITQKYSPEQVCGYLLKHQHIKLHHSTLYRYLAKDRQNGGDLYTHLRIVSKPYRRQYGSGAWTKGSVPDRTDIEHRPAIVDQKERVGDFEMDTIVGKDQKSGLVVAVERKTKFVVIRKISNFKAEDVARVVIRALKPFKDIIQTITLDNGKEFYRHKTFAKALGAETYFCRPYHSWEKGLVENTNGLIRQYFPKGTDFRKLGVKKIKAVEEALNRRPRKTLDYETPGDLFSAALANGI
ncbi:IS30 family transposase [Neisseria brasiliensis]|uniref:IS30 family transposase n=1 Tax=Neisseria brasiliensis TaxID=2666100 RepID=A0A7X2GYD1_9NEIS|nr:IS30 family transposase [Neisseria brasiliensis]MRN37578.1 IS30 family transposase [Neisseria brasiliensis]MRN37868.1 IS30 family transposase [Neisseria brasiliensis]MRN38093.1 IS30 family transposase [Neisseria brasiliensis]MRN38233.1 IS30 family transposase [Neisseria brasiliensis]MRN39290.1 IS30 family transposase [Neisseria brasiliensis]